MELFLKTCRNIQVWRRCYSTSRSYSCRNFTELLQRNTAMEVLQVQIDLKYYLIIST
jgi:hypothetical protein